jgi:putative peptidoglycan lipid II flippase
VQEAEPPGVDGKSSRRALGLGGAALVVSASVLASRLLGLLRETLLAALLGVSAEGDLYRYAFLIPDLINYLLAGGFLSITLIPLLARRVEAGDENGLWADFGTVFRVVGAAILGITATMMIFAEPLARVLFPALDAPDLEAVARLTRIVLPAQVFFVTGSLFTAAQYVQRRFLFPALAPVVYNLGIIAGGVLGATVGEPSPDAFVWGALVGAALGSFGLQWWGAHRAGLRWLRARTPVLSEYFTLALPLMVGQSVTVLDEQFPRLFGPVIGDGAASSLSLARMLNMLAVGMIAQAAAVASYPFLARLVAAAKEDEVDRVTIRSLRTTVAIALFASALFWAASGPLVRIAYQWGAFDEAASRVVASLLAIFALSIPAWGIHQVIARWFYAHRRMWLPVLIGTGATLVAIPATLLSADRWGAEGVAAASTTVIWAYTAAMALAWFSGSDNRRFSLLDALARGAVPAVAAGWAGRFVSQQLSIDSIGAALATAAVTALAVVIVYLAVARLFRFTEADPRGWRQTAVNGTPPG